MIVIPEYGNRHLTNKLIRSIPEVYWDDIFVGDDAYPEEQAPLIGGNLIQWSTNIGFSGNVNRTAAIAISDCQNDRDVLMIVNSDIEIASSDVVQILMWKVRTSQWVVGPAIVVPDGIATTHAQLFDGMSIYDQKGIEFVTAISGAFMCVPTTTWCEMEGFDEENFPAYFEDDDFCIRAWKRGIRVMVLKDVFVKHAVGKSYSKDNRARGKLIGASYRAFEKKYPNIKWDHTGQYQRSSDE